MKQHRLRVYQDKAGQWRWRLKAPNGRVIADSGEGYLRKSGAVRAAQGLCAILALPVELKGDAA